MLVDALFLARNGRPLPEPTVRVTDPVPPSSPSVSVTDIEMPKFRDADPDEVRNCISGRSLNLVWSNHSSTTDARQSYDT